MWHRRQQSEDGIALIYVIFVTMVLAGLATLFVARAVFEARATGTSANREAAIHVAEAGAENLLGDINHEGEEFSQKVITEGPTPTDTTVADHVYDPPTGLTGDALQSWEQSWVIGLAEADWELGQDTSSGYTTRVIQTVEGQAFGIRPKMDGVDQSYDAVYGVGFVPSIEADNRRVRVVKMLIARRFFSPEQALLTGGDLDFGGNAAILAPECDASDPNDVDCIADVHSNGDIDVTGTAHVIEGSMTATGTISGSPVTTPPSSYSGGEQVIETPVVSARDFYARPNVTYNVDPGGQTVEWFDLCPDGTVRSAGATPCTGTVIWNKTVPVDEEQPTRFRGWDWQAGSTQWKGTAVEAGIFYVYQANADVTGSATVSLTLQCSAEVAVPDEDNPNCWWTAATQRAVSIFVEADPVNEDNTGSLTMQGNPSFVAAFPDALFVTDNDLKLKGTSGGGNFECDPTIDVCSDLQKYSGLILVGEQASITGTVDLAGALIVSDQEADSIVVQSNVVSGTIILDYDDDLAVDLTGRVTIEFWNEL